MRKKKNAYPPGMHHAWQRFFYAVETLVEGAGDVRSRLKDAFENHLIGLHRDEFTAELWTDYQWIVQMLTSRAPQWEHETKLTATLSQMRNQTGVKIAKKIFRVWQSLELLRREQLESK